MSKRPVQFTNLVLEYKALIASPESIVFVLGHVFFRVGQFLLQGENPVLELLHVLAVLSCPHMFESFAALWMQMHASGGIKRAYAGGGGGGA